MRRKFSLLILILLTGGLIWLFLYRHENSEKYRLNNPEPLPLVQLPAPVGAYLDLIEADLDSSKNVGAAITIVHKGEIIVLRTYGERKLASGEVVDEHTVFRLASVSKGFAGVLACLLEKDSILHLDDRVTEYLPGMVLKDSVNTADLTIRHTLSHTSGLVPHAFDNLIEDGVPLPMILEQLRQVEISAPPGLLYGYQNVVFSLIDTIVRVQTGKTYAELLERKIFRPLDMKNASADADVFLRKRSNIAYPHYKTADGYEVAELNLGYYDIAPAAGVNASISDMSKWLLALLGHASATLDSSVLSMIGSPVVRSPLKRRYLRYWDRIDDKFYSLGWRIYDYKGLRIIHHGGYVRGYRAEIAFCPAEDLGIAFLQNSPNRVASESIPFFFDFWLAKTDSAEHVHDTIRTLSVPEFKFFDDTLY